MRPLFKEDSGHKCFSLRRQRARYLRLSGLICQAEEVYLQRNRVLLALYNGMKRKEGMQSSNASGFRRECVLQLVSFASWVLSVCVVLLEGRM